jgi:hypothetical protein
MMINVASDYYPYPSGRFPSDGTYNGERFRNETLAPALRAAKASGASEKVIIDIDGVRSFGSSFLEEAFGGLVRLGLFTRGELASLLEIRCTKPHLFMFRDLIRSYIESAQADLKVG